MAPPQRSLLPLIVAMAAGFACLPLRSAGAAPASSYRATVVSVGDGDTLRVQTDGQAQGRGQAQAERHTITIRLACIDAPETAQSPWGQQSRAYLMQRLPRGHQVSIQPHGTDRYGRTVAEVISTSTSTINLQMVADGQAFAYRRYLSGCDAREYLDAEVRASRHRHGVWQVEGGITRPWDFRRGRTATVIPDGTTPGGRRYRCREIGSHARAQELLRRGHTYLDSNGDGEACESLRR
jgi:endonuclease YncB( thermonuclease family)